MAFLWCVLVTTSIGVLFKLFPRWRVNTFYAIVINYTLCLALGIWLDPAVDWPFQSSIREAPWFPWVLILGMLFISGFNLTAAAVQEVGITITTLMQKMSIILTVGFALLIFHEAAGWIKLTGLFAALVAIAAINQPPAGTTLPMRRRQLIELLLVWLCAAAIEIILYVVDRTGVVASDQMAFTTHGFGTAAVIGWTIVLFRLAGGQSLPSWRDVGAGILLGGPNFFSIYLLLHLLGQGWAGSIMYPLLNVSVLIASAMVAVTLFRERLTRVNWLGIGMAIVAIALIAWSENRTP